MAVLRFLALGLLSGVMAIPLLWGPRGSGLEHARLSALIGLDAGQFVTVPVGLMIGVVLTAQRLWTRPPGHVLGMITIAFGALVVTQGWATVGWVEGRPGGIGDPDGEFVMAVLALLSGVFTTVVGVAIVLVRASGAAARPGAGAPEG
ncbi:hypothetical protein [Nonomuraea dietziae]|uniref:hypothetical protein n=1 Tax=Nonomuraea dietziae TaxID=65515 RepID=UPI003405BF7D